MWLMLSSAAGSSTISPTRSIGRSGSFLKKFKKSPGAVSQDSTTTGDTASVASSLPVSPPSKYHLRRPPRSSSSATLPALSGFYSSVHSEMGTGSSSEDGAVSDAYVGVKRSAAVVTVDKLSPPALVTVHKRPPLAPITVHSIPHRYRQSSSRFIIYIFPSECVCVSVQVFFAASPAPFC